MKKIIISMLLIAAPVATFAQLTVFSDGKVDIYRQTENPGALLAVEKNEYTGYGSYNMSIIAGNTISNNYNFGVNASCFSSTALTFGRSFGVYGNAGNATNGYNYGVYGRLTGSNNGAAVVGSLNYDLGFNISGKYAGYFDGAVYATGNLTTPDLRTPSDDRLKENIKSLADEARTPDETLKSLMSLNVIKFNFIEMPPEVSDTTKVIIQRESQGRKAHYGLSVEELQKQYPDLVCNGQDGYIEVNYVELVPILIRSIQELKQELDEVRGGDKEIMSRSTTSTVSTAKTTGNILYQNTPNPFKEQTTIRFSLADNAQNAAICIFDMTGKMLKKLPISAGDTSVNINGWELGEGMFLYTLMVNGREIDTKRMILSK